MLRSRTDGAIVEEDYFCAVAGFPLGRRPAATGDECSLGDALTTIPPLTGNGMSMAIESAAHAIEPLAQFSRGALPWARARDQVTAACDNAFARRLRWAARLQELLFRPGARAVVFHLAARTPWLRRVLFEQTRCYGHAVARSLSDGRTTAGRHPARAIAGKTRASVVHPMAGGLPST